MLHSTSMCNCVAKIIIKIKMKHLASTKQLLMNDLFANKA